MSDTTPGEIPSEVTPTNHPQVARFTVTIPPNSTVAVQFALETTYGLWTSPAPAAGGTVSIIVAGMKAASLYHMRGRIEPESGWWTTTADQTFQDGHVGRHVPLVSHSQPLSRRDLVHRAAETCGRRLFTKTGFGQDPSGGPERRRSTRARLRSD